jgi:flagellar assembly factor FliW
MQIQTRQFGAQEIDEDAVIHFPGGLPGFEDLRRFKLFHEVSEAGPLVLHLQSLDNPDVSFPVCDPAAIGFSYDILIGQAEQQALKLDDAADAALLVMLLRRIGDADTLSLAELPVVANVTAPLIVNTRAQVGLQKILTGIEYSVHVRSRG